MDRDLAKVIVMLTLGMGSMIFGLIPAAFTQYNLSRNPLLLTCFLCLGAGILMATSLVHMLPEVSEDLGHGQAEIVYCLGFLLVYLTDELLHFCCGEAIQHSHGIADEESQLIFPPSASQHPQHSNQLSYGTTSNKINEPLQTCEEHQRQHDIEDEKINERICHTSHTTNCNQTIAGVIGMLTALSIHSLIEGLAIGIQDSTAKVMVLFAAVISHKFVVGFALGVELSVSPGAKFKHHFAAIFVFSAGSVLGIAIGMGLIDLSSATDSTFLSICQGLAAGTILYVTVCEVLPRERSRWHKNQKKSAGLAQFIAFSVGFAIMTILNTYIKDSD